MKGLKILLHAVRMVVDNLDVAFRVSLVPYGAIVALNFYLASIFAPYAEVVPTSVDDLPPGSVYLQMFVIALAVLLISIWVAVAWHRFVLLGEAPKGYLPEWQGPLIFGYFGRGIAIGIMLAMLVIVMSMVVAPFLPPALGGPVIAFVALILFYRVCAVLPATALGKKLTFSQAWDATSGETGTIVALAFVGGLALLLFQVPTMLGGNPGSLISELYSLVIGWFTMIIGSGILTTFFGHYIENRPID